MKRDLRKIFIVLILFALGEGFFYNFQELWMQQNGLSDTTISTIFSLCSLLAVLFIFLFSNLIKRQHIKRFVSVLLVLKAIILLILFALNDTNLHFFIKLFIMLERAIDTEITISMYPLMSLIKVDNKTFGKKDVFYSMFYYLSLLLSGILLGRKIAFIPLNYNTFSIISASITLIAFLILKSINIKVKPEKDNNEEIVVFTLLKMIAKDKISIHFFNFLFFGQISYYAIMGLSMRILTTVFNFEPTFASNFRVCLGIAAAVFAFFALRFLTFKNDYINLSIKYVIRAVFLIISLITLNKGVYLLSFASLLFLSTSYTHVTNAPYINRYAGKYQLAFCNLFEMVAYLGNFVGYFVCGLCFKVNFWYNILLALIFLFVQLYFAFRAIYLRNRESV